MLKKLRRLTKDERGSEVVEKMLMVIASVTLVAVGITFIYKFVNEAINKQGGGAGQLTDPKADANKPATGSSSTGPGSSQ